MKYLFLCFLVATHYAGTAQSISLQLGRSIAPADHISLRYEHWTNNSINFSLGGFFERSRERQLNYSAYGIDLLAEYASNREGFTQGTFGLRYGLGTTVLIENEPWILKDYPWHKRLSYGLMAELAGEWFMTDNFTLRAGLQQKCLFHSALGHFNFLGHLSLAWKLNSY
jgi:hypothetical protein